MAHKRYVVVQNYDPQSDILYIHKDFDYEYKESVEMGINLVLDIDINNILVVYSPGFANIYI